MVDEATSKMEALKKDFEVELKKLEETGEYILQTYPRYETQAKNMISIARQKLDECNLNMFSLALGAAFQTGKSTTVNAMADGRVICPVGNGGGGIRTSSCAVQINCSLDGNKYSTVTWKTHDALNKDVRYWTGDHVSLELEGAELDKAWKIVLGDISDQLKNDSLDDKARDRIDQTLLFMSFYDDPKVTEYRQVSNYPAAELLAFLSFPPDNVSRWNAVHEEVKRSKDPNTIRNFIRSKFKVENAMYLFTEMVNFATPSEYLQAMGITVVDTPGLDMSDNDTRIALQCMNNSTAIFYLFSGDHQLSSADVQSLQQIKASGIQEKVFFGINFRRPIAQLNTIKDAILTQLKDLGFNSAHQRQLLLFNAFLAQRAKQGELILNGTLNETDKNTLLQEAQYNGYDTTDVTEAWVSTTSDVMHDVKGEGYRNFEDLGLCKESIQLAYKASHWEEMINSIVDYVLKNRSRILLMSRVVRPIQSQLEAIEQSLKNDEETSSATAAELKAKYDQAIKRYEDFQQECESQVNQIINPSERVSVEVATQAGAQRTTMTISREEYIWDRAIANNFYDSVFGKCPEKVAELATGRIQTKQTFLNNLGHFFTGIKGRLTSIFGSEERAQSALEKECAIIMKESMEAALTPLIINWQQNFESSGTYNTVIRNPIHNLNQIIRSIWTNKGMDENEILKNLREQLETNLPRGEITNDVKNVRISNSTLTNILDKNTDLSGAVVDTLKGVFGGTMATYGIAYVYIYVLPANFIIPFAAEILTVILLAATALIAKFASSARQERNKLELQNSLRDGIRNSLQDPAERAAKIFELEDGDSTKDPKVPGLSIYRLFYYVAFENAIKSCGELLQSQATQAEEDARKGDAERQRIAQIAKNIREEKIQPLQTAMENLKRKVDEISPPTRIR